MRTESMKDLIGKTITEIFIVAGEDSIAFKLSDGNALRYDTDADCCSESWFSDFIGVEFLIGNEIVDVQEIGLADPNDGRTRQESDDLFCIKFFTRKGIADLIFRNSSNGYYGGFYYKSDLPMPSDYGMFIVGDWSSD